MKRTVLLLLALAIAVAVLSSAGWGKTIYVKWDSPNNGPGNDWAHAYHSVTVGLAGAASGDQVWVARGTYTGTYTLNAGISLYGGFAGTESALTGRPAFPRSSPDTNETILDANASLSEVIWIPPSVGPDVTLDGFTIQNSSGLQAGGVYCQGPGTITNNNIRNNGGSVGSQSGGGIGCVGCSPTITYNVISGNRASWDGGGISINGGYPYVAHNTIMNNIAGVGGGGISCTGGSTAVINANSITGNTGNSKGGGIWCYQASPTIGNNTISNNNAWTLASSASDYGGGGIHLEQSSAMVSINTLQNNTCGPTGNSVQGGGVFCYNGGNNTVTGNTIYANKAGNGAGVYCLKSSPTVTSNLISSNAAAGWGGGIGNYGASGSESSGTFKNNNILFNTAATGAGVYTGNYANPTISLNWIASNTATSQGGGFYCYGQPRITGNMIISNGAGQGGGLYCAADWPYISSNTFYGNTATSGGAAYLYSGSAQFGDNILASNTTGIYVYAAYATPYFLYNDVWNNTSYNWSGIADQTGINENIKADPLFVSPSTNDFHLTSGSPCVDAGHIGVMYLPTTDYDGDARIFGGMVDIGADEYDFPVTPLASGIPQTQTGIPATYSFQVADGGWSAVGIAPTADHDISGADNVYSHSPYQTSTYGGTVRDFVVADGHDYGDATHYAQVTYGSTGSYQIEAQCQTSELIGDPVSGAFDSGGVLDLYQARLSANTSYGILVRATSGSPTLSVFVYRPSKVNGNRAGADWSLVNTVAGADAKLIFTAPEYGYYAFVVVHEDSNPGSYSFTLTNGEAISGTAKYFSGLGVSGVTITASNGGGATTTSSSGTYSLVVPPLWSGTLTAGKSGLGFIPASKSSFTTLAANLTNVDFFGGVTKTIGAAKQMADGTNVYLPAKVKTATFGSDVYFEEPDRSSAILVPGVTSTNTSANVGGVLYTYNGERCLTSARCEDVAGGAVSPLFMPNRALGGGDFGISGTGTQGTGLNNIGLLVQTSGTVIGVYSDGFNIDDGSQVIDTPRNGIGILTTGTGITSPSVGKYVTVTGISSVVRITPSPPYRIIKPRSAADVVSVRRNVLYVRGATDSYANSYANLLNSNGMPTTIIQDTALSTTNLASYDAIIVADSSSLYSTSSQVQIISNSGRPVVGIGPNGSRYFDAIGLSIGWSNCLSGTQSGYVVPQSSSNPVFHTPYEIYAGQLYPYSGSITGVAAYGPSFHLAATGIASAQPPGQAYFPLCSEGTNILWGSAGSSYGSMTTTGQHLFVNALWYATGL